MTTRTRPVTAEEPLRMPDDSFRSGLVKAELRKMPLAHTISIFARGDTPDGDDVIPGFFLPVTEIAA